MGGWVGNGLAKRSGATRDMEMLFRGHGNADVMRYVVYCATVVMGNVLDHSTKHVVA